MWLVSWLRVSSDFKDSELFKAGIHSKRTALHSSGGIGYMDVP
jgi:hypothetical protein